MASAPTLNLYLQLFMLAVLTLGLILAKRKRLSQHGWLMFGLFAVNIASIIVVMVPVASMILTRFGGTSYYTVTILHGILGVAVLVLSLRVLANWRFRKPGESCYALKGEMMRLYILWVAEAILGIAVYYQLYA
jgi:uncharacterized membrane protein YozB (DUF420 family)